MSANAHSTDNAYSFLQLPQPRPGSVVLISGGLDSAIMAGMTLESGEPVFPLYVRQGFVWEDEELAAVGRFLRSLGNRASKQLLNELSVATISAPAKFSVSWAMKEEDLPPHVDTPDEDVYLPGRNLALLSQASILAYSVGVSRIKLGILHSNPFPDATENFFRSFENSVFEAMQWRVRVETPLASMSKIDVIQRGIHFDLGNTISCARPRDGIHCGLCSKCSERYRAFRKAGLIDPARYAREISD